MITPAQIDRASVWRRLTHRTVAVLLAVVHLITLGEPLLAEVHESAAVSSVHTLRDVGTSAAASLSGAVGLDDTTVTSFDRATHPAEHVPDSPTHAVHLCHCAHAHVATLSVCAFAPRAVILRAARTRPDDWHLPASADRAPMLRPPTSLAFA